MLFKLSTVVAFLLAASPALSTIVVTSPVASTKGKGGKKLDIEWNDDGKSPKLSSDWGSINIFLATGSHDVQFKLQELATGLSNSKTSGNYRIDKTVGPSGSDYFIRFESTKTGSDGNPAAMAFSSKFQITGMTGTFNQTVQDAINGKAGGDGQGTTGGPSSTSAIRTSIVASTATNTNSATGLANNSGLASNNNGTSAAGRIQVGSALVGFGAVAAGVVALL